MTTPPIAARDALRARLPLWILLAAGTVVGCGTDSTTVAPVPTEAGKAPEQSVPSGKPKRQLSPEVRTHQTPG